MVGGWWGMEVWDIGGSVCVCMYELFVRFITLPSLSLSSFAPPPSYPLIIPYLRTSSSVTLLVSLHYVLFDF